MADDDTDDEFEEAPEEPDDIDVADLEELEDDDEEEVLLDDDALYCARKYPPSVTGDGVHSFRELLAIHNDALRARGLSPASMP